MFVLLGGLVAVAVVAWRASPTDEHPRRPTDDAEVLEQALPRAARADAGAPDAGSDAP